MKQHQRSQQTLRSINMKYFSVLAFLLLCYVMIASSTPVPQDESSGSPEAICKLKMRRGYCRALIPRWMYDVNKGECVEFKYGGCGGNGNNFKTKESCEATCKGIRR